MIHMYKNRNFNSDSYSILCTGTRMTMGQLDQRPMTIPSYVTYPKCLDILIPKQEALLEKLKKARAAWTEPTSITS